MEIVIVFISILLLEFGLDRLLAYLNNKNSSATIPQELTDIYEPDKYSKQQQYFQTNYRFGMFISTFNLIVVMIILVMGGFGMLDLWIGTQLSDPVWQSLLFFGILYIGNDILQTPFEWDRTFNIEARYGFNTTTTATFIADKLKSWLVTAIMGGLILYAIVSLYYITSEYFWLLAFSVVTFFSLFMGMFYSELIVPLFNKQKPLADGELRDAIETMAVKAGFKLKNIFVIDGSKRSTKANAYFTGFGPKKRIVLYDTLMDKLTTEEIVAVLAHEIGHYKKKHIIKSYAFTLPFNLLMFYLLGLFLNSDSLAIALGGTKAVFHLNAIAFFILYTPLSTILDLTGNIISRKNEYEADAFAATYGLKDALISGLKKLSSTSLSNLMPHPLYVFFNYSHPTLLQRMKKLQSLKI